MISIRSKMVSRERTRARTEIHPWLKFNHASAEDKIIFTNRLALLQDKQISQPRYMDFSMSHELEVEEIFEKMFDTTINVDRDGKPYAVTFPVWTRIFKHSESSCREWMLEFYSTVRITRWPTNDEELMTERVLSFHCGGIRRRVTIPEFGYYAGLYPLDFLEDPEFSEFLKAGVRDSQGFDNGNEKDYYVRISSESSWSPKSKVNLIRSPILRILQKIICYNYQQRSFQQEKPYKNDLRLMRMFDEEAPYTYACFPYVLAKHMLTHKDSQLFCGNFITSLVKNFNCHTHPDNVHCSVRVPAKEFTWLDFARWKVLGPMSSDGLHQLIEWRNSDDDSEDDDDDEYAAAAQDQNQDQVMEDIVHDQPFQQPHEQPHGYAASSCSFSFDNLAVSLSEIQASQRAFYSRYEQDQRRYEQDQRRHEEDHQWLGSQIGYLAYNQDRFRPHWESIAQPVPAYQPPDIFIPMHRQGGFYYPPQAGQQIPRYDHLPRFGTYVGTSGASGSGSGNPAQDYADQIFGTPDPHRGDGTHSAFGPPQ